MELGNTGPSLDQFRKSFVRRLSMAYEEVARAVLRASGGTIPFPLGRVGRWWCGNEEIDFVGTNDGLDAILFAEVEREAYALFSKSGFTAEMKRIAREDRVLLFHQERHP